MSLFRPFSWKPSGRRVASVAVAMMLAWLGAALAQQDGALDLDPRNLFGSLPEPSTESAPPPPVLDPANPDHHKLQPPQEAYAPLPRDARGRPDWARALREGAIQPRSAVAGNAPAPQPLELDILMKDTAQMPWVKFGHQAHTQWLTCASCHDGLFAPRAGANPTNMTAIFQGESCGACHGRVAFTPLFTCERCHSEPQPGQQRWW
jgi:c(7)-type cytochrome triheme protein